MKRRIQLTRGEKASDEEIRVTLTWRIGETSNDNSTI